MESILHGLQDWYARQFDGLWENDYGVKITTCDNPGWWGKIDLVGTELQDRSFESIAESVDGAGSPQGPRWLHCRVPDAVWHGAGDESKLAVILMHFLAWAGGGDAGLHRPLRLDGPEGPG
ncbi:Imm53 family immunity protein [Paludisphaera mucosa]|uniref:Imm53 family immunity protein n=1 Tax=Paludisphaera mucosa TaxID=3030827 RepID=A0ABT6FDE8_9BACT|nr:Imm53 family immunity protein [Paludisphaera mucosa]MDG3005601.1 Imm53 family immunity protein [Paludisphaera mucosa]